MEKKEDIIDNEGPTITEADIHEYKTKTTMYWKHLYGGRMYRFFNF
jgi:hypothetical protein